MARKVVITGASAISALGLGLEEYWGKLAAGANGIQGLDFTGRFSLEGVPCKPEDFRSRMAAVVPDSFEPTAFMEKSLVKDNGRFTQMAITVTRLALDQAQLLNAELKIPDELASRVGVISGSGIGGIGVWETNYRRYLEGGPRRVLPKFIPSLIIDMSAGLPAILFGAKGPNFSAVSACASSAHAIGVAFDQILLGRAGAVIVIGTEELTPFGLASFCAMRALSNRNEDPEHACRPFDKERDGFVCGEGAAALILEDEEFARARGLNKDDFLGVILGWGASCDASHITAPDPNGEGAAASMAMALKQAGLNPEDIDYINAHGTSTPLNDKIETLAIKKVFGARAKQIPVSSTKSMIGHTLGAAGALEVVATLLPLNRGIIHPTINYEFPDPECDLDYVPNESRKAAVSYALSNSFGFGGHNVTLAVARYPR